MSEKVAISVQGVSKNFKLPHEKHAGLKQTVLNFRLGDKNYEVHQVLKDVTFEIKQGEFFGIIGRNGSGKSTLLKVLAGIYQPTSGTTAVHGKLVPFIELGVGFNPELTGRENVFLNGALLGFSKKQTEAMYDKIVEFAELEDFMDQKLKNYSSGMQVRLAFSIAIRARSDILLVDEVLAVGDEAFQRKCLDVFEQYKAEKQTVILVTHDMETVRKFCTRAMLINNGDLVEIGDPRRVAEKYSKLNQEIVNRGIERENKKKQTSKLLKARILNIESKSVSYFEPGESLFVEVLWKGLQPNTIESIGVNIFKLSGEHITGINTRDSLQGGGWKKNGQIKLQIKLNVAPGTYYVIVEVFDEAGKVIDSVLGGLQFSVNKSLVLWSGLVELPYKWYEK